jgi:hypothetical protein
MRCWARGLPCCPTCRPSPNWASPGYETTLWRGLLAPAGTPREVVAKINAEAVAMLNAPEVRQRIPKKVPTRSAARPTNLPRMKSEIAKWAKVIREAGIGTSDRVARMDRSESGCVARVSAQKVHLHGCAHS